MQQPRPVSSSPRVVIAAAALAVIVGIDRLAAPACAQINSGLLVNLQFEGNTNDASTNGNNFSAALTPAYGAGFIGAQSMALSEVGYAFTNDADFKFGTASNFTIAFWTKFTNDRSSMRGDPSFVSNKSWASGGNIGYVIATDSDGRIQWNYREFAPDQNGVNTTGRSDYDSGADVFTGANNNVWRHVAVTFSRNFSVPIANDTPLIFGLASTYIDGVRINRSLMNNNFGNINGLLPATGEELPTVVGNDGTGAYGDGFWGSTSSDVDDAFIDDLGIWNRALSPAEVAQISAAGRSGNGLASFGLANRWGVDAGGNWTDARNWEGGVPNASAAVANLGSVISAARTISVNSPITVGAINFYNDESYTVAGTSALTLANGTATANITLAKGNHTITAPLNNGGTADIIGPGLLTVGAISNTGSLTVQTTVTAGHVTGTGTLRVENGRTLTAQSVRQGVLSVGLAAHANLSPTGPVQLSRVGGLAIDLDTASNTAGGRVDLGNGGLVVDHGGTNPFNSIASAVRNAYSGGDWDGNGIGSSAAAASPTTLAVGFADNALLGASTFFGEAVGPNTVLARLTRVGDANLDGTTGIADFSSLAANFNAAGTWRTGDFNYDGQVNIGDFSLLAANFNQSVSAAARPGAVPEPSVISLVTLAAAALTARRRSR